MEKLSKYMGKKFGENYNSKKQNRKPTCIKTGNLIKRPKTLNWVCCQKALKTLKEILRN